MYIAPTLHRSRVAAATDLQAGSPVSRTSGPASAEYRDASFDTPSLPAWLHSRRPSTLLPDVSDGYRTADAVLACEVPPVVGPHQGDRLDPYRPAAHGTAHQVWKIRCVRHSPPFSVGLGHTGRPIRHAQVPPLHCGLHPTFSVRQLGCSPSRGPVPWKSWHTGGPATLSMAVPIVPRSKGFSLSTESRTSTVRIIPGGLTALHGTVSKRRRDVNR